MEHSNRSNGSWTFWEHYGFPLIGFVGFASTFILEFFEHLSGTDWIHFFIASETTLFIGTALITYAKMPTYLAGEFFTFGIKSVLPHMVPYYRWGWRIFLMGVGLSFCLLLSKP